MGGEAFCCAERARANGIAHLAPGRQLGLEQVRRLGILARQFLQTFTQRLHGLIHFAGLVLARAGHVGATIEHDIGHAAMLLHQLHAAQQPAHRFDAGDFLFLERDDAFGIADEQYRRHAEQNESQQPQQGKLLAQLQIGK